MVLFTQFYIFFFDVVHKGGLMFCPVILLPRNKRAPLSLLAQCLDFFATGHDNFTNLFVSSQLFHVMTPALNSISSSHKLSHFLEYFAVSIIKRSNTFFGGGNTFVSCISLRIQHIDFVTFNPRTQYFLQEAFTIQHDELGKPLNLIVAFLFLQTRSLKYYMSFSCFW